MSIEQTVADHGQEHVLQYVDDISPAGRKRLLDQLRAIAWDEFDEWVDNHVRRATAGAPAGTPEPAPYLPLEPDTPDRRELYARARAQGVELLRAGAVAAFTVAGGQGTRLGFNGPKGTYPISPVRQKSLFQLFAETIARNGALYGRPIPWYIMTSPQNDSETRDFFDANACFGLAPDAITFFRQGQMPAFDFDGRLLLAARDSLALSPDGHGGSLRALHVSGALEDMSRRGIEHISYFQVDNPLVTILDPLFIGLHHLQNAQMSNRMVPKLDAREKMGVFCQVDGRTQVVEYSDLPADLAADTDADGRLHFVAGSPAIHLLRRDFVAELNAAGFSLPWHRAVKKVPCLDDTGNLIEPAEPNAVKLETFVFDALRFTDRTIILEAKRADEFAPVKNKEGRDSPATCRRLMQEQFARWLTAAGVRVPRRQDGSLDCRLEISPHCGVSAEDFGKGFEPITIKPGDEVYLQ